MISIVMTYRDRQEQLTRTLESLKQYDPMDFNVIIVDDCSVRLIEYQELPYECKVIRIEEKIYPNSSQVYNIGFLNALDSDIIIIQNAECYHGGDILGYAKTIKEDQYITFACYSQGQEEEPGSVINNRCATFDGESAWYNHPIYRPVGYHFCSAITIRNLIKLNGFDERFSPGIGYEDDYLLYRIRLLGLKVEITSDPIVYHQWHYTQVDLPNKLELIEKNKLLYQELIKENNYIAQHLITPDL